MILLYIFSQVDPVSAATVKGAVEAADNLASKDLKWWFIFVLVVLAVVVVTVLKYALAGFSKYITSMESQLTEQRTAHATVAKQHYDYITGDHLKSIEAQQTMAQSMKELAQAIRELSIHNNK